jgi:hypothetical protein
MRMRLHESECSSFSRTLGIRAIGGKANATMQFQLRVIASWALAAGSRLHEQYVGSWWFVLFVKRLIWGRSILLKIVLQTGGLRCHSTGEPGTMDGPEIFVPFRERASVRMLSKPGRWTADRKI